MLLWKAKLEVVQTSSLITSGARKHVILIEEVCELQLQTTEFKMWGCDHHSSHINVAERGSRRNIRELASSWCLVHSSCRKNICVVH